MPRELPVIKACFSLDVISETSSVLVWLIGPLVTRSFYVIGLVSIGPSFNLPLQLVGTRDLSSPAAQEAGAAGFFEKPYDPEELLATIDEILRLHIRHRILE